MTDRKESQNKDLGSNGLGSPKDEGRTRSTRANRGQRLQLMSEDELKADAAFWKSNPLFKDIEEENDEEENDDENDNDEDQKEDEEANSEDQEDGDFEGLEDAEEDTSFEILPNDDEGEENGEDEDGTDPERIKLLEMLSANRENHFFHRPIFLKRFIKDLQRENFSYIKIPDDYPKMVATNENEISSKVINNLYIGVPPKAPKEFLTIPHNPNYFEYEMFRLEDERYHLDSNILKYGNIIQKLENLLTEEDEGKRKERLSKLLKSYKIFRQKFDVAEEEDDISKIKKVKEDLSHDLENIKKKRDVADSNSKHKKELFYPLAIRNREIAFAEDERDIYENAKFIQELSIKHIKVSGLKETSELEEFKKIYFENSFLRTNEKVLFNNEKVKQTIECFAEDVHSKLKSNPQYILPSENLFIKQRDILIVAYELVLVYMKSNAKIYDKERVAKNFKSLIEKIFKVDLPDFEKLEINFDEQTSQNTLDEYTKYTLDFKKDETELNLAFEDFDATPIDSEAQTYEEDKFLPQSLKKEDKIISSAIYGTHYFYYLIKYFYSLYCKLLMAFQISKKTKQENFEKFLIIAKLLLSEKIEDVKFYIAIMTLFEFQGKYLFHIKHIIHNLIQILMSINNDYLSEKLLKFDEYTPSPENFVKVASQIRKRYTFSYLVDIRNGISADIKHHMYRFSYNTVTSLLSVCICKPPEEIIEEEISEQNENEDTNKSEKKYIKRKEPPVNIQEEEPSLIKKVVP